MSWQEKVQFWKKHDDSVDDPIKVDPLLEHRNESNPFVTDAQQTNQNHQFSQQDPFAQQSAQQQDPFAQQNQAAFPTKKETPQSEEQFQKRDVELILSRLDLIKSELENIQHRMSSLEKNKPKW